MKQLNFKFQFVLACLSILIFDLRAQIDYADFITSGEHDTYYKVAVRERNAVSLPHLREADVKYSKRIIRCIDSRQKMNKALNWPRQMLINVLYPALKEGKILPFKNDSLSSAYTTTDFSLRGTSLEIITICPDPDDIDLCYDSEAVVPFEQEKIEKYWVMEDWIFDYKHGSFQPRILAIAPIYKPVFSGFEANEQPLCWIEMDDNLRNYLASKEMFNRYNQAARLSFDDFFQMRLFDSYIVYESNVFDNFINQFQAYENDGVAALLESDHIKNDLFIFEHDLWQY
jgi:gliding motility associated protien GldN